MRRKILLLRYCYSSESEKQVTSLTENLEYSERNIYLDNAEKEMSARSVRATFSNGLKVTLHLLGTSLVHGEWTTNPPSTIAPGGTGEWQSDSNGFMTGTEGTCTYQFVYTAGAEPTIESVKMYWDNPFRGSDAYSITCSVPEIKVGWSEGNGDNATVHYKIGL